MSRTRFKGNPPSLTKDLSTFLIKDNPVFSNDPKSYLKILLVVFDNFILAEKLFLKAILSFETCVLLNNLESATAFDESFKVTSVPYFIPDFNILS